MTASGRPLVAIVHGEGSVSPMKLSASAAALCDVVWVIDSSEPNGTSAIRLLRKLGTAVDVAGMSEDEVAEALRPLQPDGIAAYADQQLAAASALASRLGLPFHDGVVAQRLLDKSTQRRALRDGGLPVPRSGVVPRSPTAHDLETLAAGVDFPVVLKPRHGAASRDTVLVRDATQLAALLAQPLSTGAEPSMVIEEYMVGSSLPPSPHFADYLSVESVVTSGRISHVAVTGRLAQAEPFRETGLVIPSDFDPTVVKEVLGVATQAITALGIQTGCLHTEIKMTDAGPRVIEVNGRLGGFVPEVLAQAVPGVDLFEISQRVALGHEIIFPDVVTGDRVGYVIVEQPPQWAHHVSSVEGLDRLSAYPGVSDVVLSRQPGDEVDWRKGSHEYVYSVIGSAPDHAGVVALQRFIDAEVKVTYS
jgi:biotin carboxylase